MGWGSWNLYQTNISEAKIKAQADAMVSTGLSEKGYEYIVIDDGCLQATRSADGLLQPQTSKFPNGFKSLSDYIHSLGLKFGMYNAAGTMTCQRLAGSYDHEYTDAQTFADWGTDFLKYDWCNNPLVDLPTIDVNDGWFNTSFESTVLRSMGVEAPTLSKVVIQKVKDGVVSDIKTITFSSSNTALSGGARFEDFGGGVTFLGMLDANSSLGKAGSGTLTFDMSAAEMDPAAKYRITVYCLNADKQRLLSMLVNPDTADFPHFYIKSEKSGSSWSWSWDSAAPRTIQNVPLVEGANTIEFYLDRADCLEGYREDTARSQGAMATALEATGRPVLFNVCEWGWSQPYLWGSKVGQSWRSTTDINYDPGIGVWDNDAYGRSIMQVYENNVLLDEYAGPYAYNDPDVLCVGLSNLNYEQNKSHFTLWCMMAAPLFIGTDMTTAPQNVLDILGNEQAIAIDQDPLCLQGKRFMQSGSGMVDYIVKPLADGSVALCIFNKASSAQNGSVTLQQLANAASDKATANGSDHLTAGQTALFTQAFANAASYNAVNLWAGTSSSFSGSDTISTQIPAYGVATYIVTPVAG